MKVVAFNGSPHKKGNMYLKTKWRHFTEKNHKDEFRVINA
jgi:multimeric flavodoxin WrbA